MTPLDTIILAFLVTALAVSCYIVGRIDQTLANLKRILPPTHKHERGTK